MHKAKAFFLSFQITFSVGAMTPTPPLPNQNYCSKESLQTQKNSMMSGMYKSPLLKKSALFSALGATCYSASWAYYFLEDRTARTEKISKQCANLKDLLAEINTAKELHEHSSTQVRELAKAVNDKGVAAAYDICPLREATLSHNTSFNFSFTQRLRAAIFKQERERFYVIDSFEHALDTYLDSLYKSKDLLMAVSQKKD